MRLQYPLALFLDDAASLALFFHLFLENTALIIFSLEDGSAPIVDEAFYSSSVLLEKGEIVKIKNRKQFRSIQPKSFAY